MVSTLDPMTARFLHGSASALLLAAFTTVVTAQSQLLRVNGHETGNRFGSSVACLGDVDGDTVPDIVVGGVIDNTRLLGSGYIRVHSGASGAVLYTIRGTSSFDFYGHAVGNAGDVNGDGVHDIIVGVPFEDVNGQNAGQARVLNGVNGSTLWVFNGASANDQFGYAVAGAGDVNADGYDDVIVGAWLDDSAGVDVGRAFVYSGRTGAPLWVLEGGAVDDNFGRSVAGAGDVDADGFADVIVGAYRTDTNGMDAGTATVFSGRTGAALWTIQGDSAGDRFGASVAGVGDIDRDGHADIAVGAVLDDDGANEGGSVRVYSGQTGAVLWSWFGQGASDWFGNAIAGAGDVNGDGHADVIVASFQNSTARYRAGKIEVFSGATGAILMTQLGTESNERFGWSVAGGLDYDADGYSDVLVGSRYADSGTDFDNGSAFLFDVGISGGTPSIELVHGRACRGGNGHLPRIGVVGRGRVGETFDVTLRGSVPGTAGATLFVGASTNLPLSPIGLTGCTLLVNPLFDVATSTDTDGLAAITIPVANDPAVIGIQFGFQWVLPDLAAPRALPLSLSNGLTVTFGG